MEFTKVKLNEDGSGYITDSGFIPKGHRFEALVNKFVKDGGVIEPFKTDSELLAEAKAKAEKRIKDGFEEAFLSGTFMSMVLGIEVDNRRSGSKNDKDNLEGRMAKGEYPFTWIGFESSAEVGNVTTAEALRLEMINDGEARYINKWAKEQAIADAFTLEGDKTTPTTVADYDAIVW